MSDTQPSLVSIPEPHRGVLIAIQAHLASKGSTGSLYNPDAIEALRLHYENVGFVPPGIEWLIDNNLLANNNNYLALTPKAAEALYQHQNTASSATKPDAVESVKEEWSPLPLDRDTDAAKTAIQATQDLTDRVRGENGFAATEPETHAAVVWSLQTGLDAIKNRAPSRAQIESLLLAPMRKIREKFKDATIGELAKFAIAALLKWIF